MPSLKRVSGDGKKMPFQMLICFLGWERNLSVSPLCSKSGLQTEQAAVKMDDCPQCYSAAGE